MRSAVAYGSFVVSIALLIPATLVAQETIRVFAAASLADALSAVASDFEASRTSSRITMQFGSSSDLARQILAGAPAALFFSADRRQLDRVAAKGYVQPGERADVLSNELVVVSHRDRPDIVIQPEDLLKLDRIAMADPEAVPAGVYAREYLESKGLWRRLQSKVVPTLDVRAALAAVASGNIDAGFVYHTDASIDERVRIVYSVPRDEGPGIYYSLGIIRGARDRQRSDVRELYDYMKSEAAGEIFERFGFVFLELEP